MASIIRKDPHQLNRGFVTPEGIKRIARDRDTSGELESANSSAILQPSRREVKNPDGSIMALVMTKKRTLDILDQEILYTARFLAEDYGQHSVIALLCGDCDEDLGALGADQVMRLNYDLATDHNPVTLAYTIASLVSQHNPKHLVGGDSDWGDGDMLRRVAAITNKSFAHKVIAINQQQLICEVDTHRQAVGSRCEIIAITSGLTSRRLESSWHTSELKSMSVSNAPALPTYTLPPEDIALTEAPLICSAGNGVTDIDLFVDCAKALGASVGASRVVTDAGILPRSRQVGATGTSVNASAYLCFGISGAVQHLQGIRDCQMVIAVNTDASCPMVRRADFAFIADAGEVMHALLEEMKCQVTQGQEATQEQEAAPKLDDTEAGKPSQTAKLPSAAVNSTAKLPLKQPVSQVQPAKSSQDKPTSAAVNSTAKLPLKQPVAQVQPAKSSQDKPSSAAVNPIAKLPLKQPVAQVQPAKSLQDKPPSAAVNPIAKLPLKQPVNPIKQANLTDDKLPAKPLKAVVNSTLKLPIKQPETVKSGDQPQRQPKVRTTTKNQDEIHK